MPHLAVELAPRHSKGLRLRNPVMIASGTFGWDGWGRGLTADFGIGRLGAVLPKTLTRYPHEGNPEPRWTPQSFRRAWQAHDFIFLNSVGLANPGIEAGLKEMLPEWLKWQVPVILSIAGESVAEFEELAAIAEGAEGVAGLELNLSCPNVQRGLQFGQSAELVGQAVRAAKRVSSLPVIAKLTPNVSDILPVALAAEEAGADALTLTNTLSAMLIDIEGRKPVLGGITGGLSGMSLKPVSLAMVYKVAPRVGVPVIGCGGVFTCKDALEYIMAGATAVQMGSANLVDFGMAAQVVDGLSAYLEEKGIGDLKELIGAAQV